MEQQMDTDAAIQEDVAEVIPPPDDARQTTDIELVLDRAADLSIKSDRSSIIDQITQRRNEELQEELEPQEEVEPIEEELSDDVPQEPLEDETIEVKVDGVTSKVTEKEIREYQKQLAADKRLEESRAIERQLQEKERLLSEREQKLRALEAERELKAANASLDEIYDELNEGVFGDDREKGIKALSKLVSQRAINPAEVEAVVQRALAEKENRRLAAELERAKNRFSEEYPFLTKEKDEELHYLVDRRTVIEKQKDPNASFWEIIDRSAKYVSNKYIKPVSNPEDSMEDRVARKRAAGPIARAIVTKKAPISKPQVKQLSPFEELQRSRGQG